MDVREKYVMQKVNRKEKSICQNCIHHNLCIAENNQPCFECNRFMDANGVTVHEWISVKEPPKEKGTYIVCTDNGGVLLGHWYGTAWNVGGGAKKHLAYWMEKPKPPKGE